MNTKEIERVLAPPPAQWVGNGFKVHNFFPNLLDAVRMSPFCLLNYNAKMFFPPSNIPRGMGAHPHRGIDTVTIVYHGRVAHHDSAGNGGVTGEGDVQWMTAGSGVLHKEYYEATANRKGGNFQMVQLWVNLPQKSKMTAPRYQGLSHERIPKYALPNEAGVIEVIAGSQEGMKGLASTFSPLEIYNIRLVKGGSAVITLPQFYNTGILVVKGLVKVNDATIALTDQFILFGNMGEDIHLQAVDETILLVLSGEPINETIAIGGSFVMNTREEIIQAFQDYDNGQFGYLEI